MTESEPDNTAEFLRRPEVDSDGAVTRLVQFANDDVPKYDSVQEMVDAISTPEFAEEFRRHQRRPLVRLRKWWLLLCARLKTGRKT